MTVTWSAFRNRAAPALVEDIAQGDEETHHLAVPRPDLVRTHCALRRVAVLTVTKSLDEVVQPVELYNPGTPCMPYMPTLTPKTTWWQTYITWVTSGLSDQRWHMIQNDAKLALVGRRSTPQKGLHSGPPGHHLYVYLPGIWAQKV